MKIDYRKIKKLPLCHYHVNVEICQLWEHIQHYITKFDLQLNPDFQRGHVWTQQQKTDYIQWVLRGGTSGKSLFFNHPGWMKDWKGEMVLVDGKQRIQAVREFLDDRVEIFGGYTFSDFGGTIPPWSGPSFDIYIANLKTRSEVLEWYLMMNTGGTAHSPTEINHVRKLLRKENQKTK